MDHDNRHSVSVAGVILDDQGRALLIQRRDNGRWEAPGGILELGEAIQNGLHREILEETGLDIQPDGLSGIYKNMTRGIIALVFRCHVIGGRLRETDESQAFRWMTAEQVQAQATEAFAARVLDAMNSDPAPTIRHHDGTHMIEIQTHGASTPR